MKCDNDFSIWHFNYLFYAKSAKGFRKFYYHLKAFNIYLSALMFTNETHFLFDFLLLAFIFPVSAFIQIVIGKIKPQYDDVMHFRNIKNAFFNIVEDD